MSLGHFSIDVSKIVTGEPDWNCLPILPTRNLVLFPGVNAPLTLGREGSLRVAEYAERHSKPICIVCQRDPSVEKPEIADLFGYGVVADVLKVLELPDGTKTALVRARDKVKIEAPAVSPEIPSALAAQVKPIHEAIPRKTDKEFLAVLENIEQMARTIVGKTLEGGIAAIPFDMDDLSGSPLLINMVACHFPLSPEAKEKMLAAPSLRKRAMMLLGELDSENNRIDMNREIMERARAGMEQNQRNAFLQQQMDTIREELYGDESDDIAEFERRIAEANLPEAAATTLNKELAKLRRLNPQSPDYSVQYSYLDTVLSLPWNSVDNAATEFSEAEAVLEADHYGLEKVKERIVEQVAMVMANPKGKSPILCLVGPPGVGKTSLGASIARAMGRKYQRVALGGLHDEAEIRGHRRTYIGAMPGRIIDAMRRAGTRNPVLLLDEIDKIGADYKGDPAAALLEVLDPEQNVRFHDNYIDIDFDLSQVLFIATANTLQTVSRPLLDRIEVIDIAGYLPEEKLEIARRHLIPGLIRGQEDATVKVEFSVEDDAIMAIIADYTSESGVRQLEKNLAKLMRKAVLAEMRGKPLAMPVRASDLKELLGTPPFHRDELPASVPSGVVTGLAWTAAGGEILLVEVSLAKSKQGGKLTLTGNLGDVMKESATIALQWVKANAAELGIDSAMFDTHNVHVHFPEGAIPKDGPSAGITMATAIASAFTGKAVAPRLAMTGEITLRGQVLPVGGIREKILAARRAGVTDIILCNDNRRDVDDIPAEYLTGLTIHYHDGVREVIEQALA